MTDDGLKFFATVQKASGETLSRETADRVALLVWVRDHCAADDDLTVTVESRGAAARNTIAALMFGAMQLEDRRT